MNYSSSENRSPAAHGVFDLSLGASKDKECGTCHQNFVDCPGHFGHVPLSLPIFHTGYITHTYNLLQMICKTCSRVLLEDRKNEAGEFIKDPQVMNSREYFRFY